MALKDYYKILGVDSAASPEEIKKTYRRLARELHPDATGGDKEKEAQFQEITAAYEILSDGKRRDLYDAARRPPRSPQKTPPPSAKRYPTGQPGFDVRGGRGGSTSPPRPNPGPTAPPRPAAASAPRPTPGPIPSRAPAGATAPPSGGSTRAPFRGRIELTLLESILGTEKTLTLEMPNGTERDIQLRIPPGILDGEAIRVPGIRPGVIGGGDVLLNVAIASDPRFRLNGANLETDLVLPLHRAILGGPIEVPTLEGPAKLTIPECSGTGTRITIKGKGGSDRMGVRGDLHVFLIVAMPTQLTDEQRELLQRFAVSLIPVAAGEPPAPAQ